ncbi:MAG: protein kinase [Planctomycetota bacterium]|nr:protein kinase [Planctomycetota bacterium]
MSAPSNPADDPRKSAALNDNFSQNEFEETVDRRESSTGSDAGVPAGTAAGIPASVGRYEIRGLLGKGAFGVVYRGFDGQLDRQVAIKVPLLKNPDPNFDFEKKFLAEARQLAKLAHPGIVTVFDVSAESGLCYIVSDFLDGLNLNQWLKQNNPDWIESSLIVARIADALAHAHSMSTVHRDIKPDNILMVDRAEGLRPVLVDFGLAVSEDVASASERGHVMGTPNYMAPEQVRGRGHRIDGRTDIYALGVVLYRMLSGRLPFRSPQLSDLLKQIEEDEPQPPRQLVHSIPPEVEKACLKAMAKQVTKRYSTAADFAADLRQAVARHQQSGSSSAVGPSAEAAFVPDSADPSMHSTASVSATRIAEPDPPSRQEGSSLEFSSTIRRARAAERRQVTVMYCRCDLFESPEFMDNLDAEEQHEVLGEYQHICDEAVKQFEGTVIEATSEGLLVAFGYPVAFEDAAQRAIRSALGIRDGLLKFNKQLKKQNDLSVAFRIGIHTGQVVAEDKGDVSVRDSLSIVGEPRNVATRMIDSAQENSIVITGSTNQVTAGFFVCETIGTQSIRGSSKPLELFSVTGESKARSRLDLMEPTELTPLIGRDTELNIMRERWEQASESMGQVVLLIGDAGLGKSRLVHEIKGHVGQSDREMVIEWRCSPYHRNSGLYSAIDFFERQLAFTAETPPNEKLDTLVDHLAEYNLDTPDVVPLFAALLSIPVNGRYSPPEVSPQRIMELTLQAMHDLLREYSYEQPVLFIVEDLHWIDPTSLEFVGKLVEESASDSIMTLLTFRPEFETPWSSKAHQTQVALNKLTKNQVAEMMRKKTGINNLPAEVIAQVVDRTDGVPLFVEEFTKVVEEAAESIDGESSLQVSVTFDLSSIPTTLQDLLLSRLNRMESLHDVVQIAATIGRECSHELLAAVIDVDDATLQEEINKLVSAEILFQRGRPPRARYLFKHALIQDAAYQSLVKKKRQAFHQKIGEVLESDFPQLVETQPELLAQHFSEAGDVQKGIDYCLKAGKRSQERSAHAEAITQFKRGLELVAKLDEGLQRDQIELGFLVPLGVVYMATKGWSSDDVGNTFQRAKEVCERLGAKDHEFNVMWGLWGWHVLRGEFDTCMEIAAYTTELAESLQHPAILMEAPWIPALTQFYRGEFKASIENMKLGFSRFDRETSLVTTLATGQNCGVTYQLYESLNLWYLGFPDQALRRGEDAMETAIDLKHPFSHCFALWHRSWLYNLLRDHETAERLAAEALNMATEQSFILWKCLAMCDHGYAMFKLGQTEGVLEPVEQGAGVIMFLGSKLNLPHFAHYRAEIKAGLGRIDDGLADLEFERQHAHDSNEKYTLPELHRLRGEFLLLQLPDNAAAAESEFRQAIEFAREREARSWELRAATSLARLLQQQDTCDEAREVLSGIYNWFTEGLETPDLTDAKSLLDELG